jgi:predicted ATPase with chaperone activity
MLAHRLTTMLPALTLPEAIDTTRIHRIAGRTGDRPAVVTTRPCRAPHHTISDVGLIGGGQVPRPECRTMSSPRDSSGELVRAADAGWEVPRASA